MTWPFKFPNGAYNYGAKCSCSNCGAIILASGAWILASGAKGPTSIQAP